MNTPSKEALEAARDVRCKIQHPFGWQPIGDPEMAVIIDRHFAQLRKRLAEMESLLASEKTTRNAIIAKGLAAEQRNAELAKQEAESRRLFYAEQDKRQSVEFRCEELAGALREARHLAASWESADGEPATELLKRIDAALDAVDAGEPEGQK